MRVYLNTANQNVVISNSVSQTKTTHSSLPSTLGDIEQARFETSTSLAEYWLNTSLADSTSDSLPKYVQSLLIIIID